MKIKPFELERYFAKYEFSVRYLLSSSDCEALSMSALREMMDTASRRLWDELVLGYTESAGHPLLREAIAEIYANISPEAILVAAPEEGIFLFMHALLKPGDHAVCAFPAYQSLYEIARSIGCNVSNWEADENQGWRFNVDRLEALLRPETRLVVVNFPHNPTGHIPQRNDYEAIIDLVRQRGAYLLSDEMYRFLEFDAGAALQPACELYDRAFSLCGLSKAFGLPGLRIGWIASQNQEILTRMAGLKDYTTICASAPSEILAITALRNKDKIVSRQLDRLKRNLTVLDEFFAEYDDCFDWNRPAGSSVCFPRLMTQQGATEICDHLVKSAGIMLVPAQTFHFGDRHVRIGFGRENLPEVIERFSDYLSEQFR